MDALQKLATLLLQLFAAVTARGLTESQRRQLGADLPRDAVKKREQAGQTLSYIDGHFAISRANDVFGPDGWSYRAEEIREIHRGSKPGRDGENTVIVYEAIVTVRALGAERTDVGIGQCDASLKALAQGIEKARKEAVTDALKRALRTFGPSFGLALYDKTQRDVGLSTVTLALLDEIDVIDVPETLRAWVDASKPVVQKLDADERDVLNGAVARRRRELAQSQPETIPAPPNEPPNEPENDPEASVGSRVWAAFVAAMPTLRTVAAVAERYIALPQDLREEGEQEPEKYLSDKDGPGALSMAREAVFRLGHRLAKDESALVVQNIALASMLDAQAKVFTLGEAVAWWRAERAAAKELGPKPAETLFYALGRRLAAELTPTATKAAVKSLKAAVEAADKGPGPGGNGGAPKPAAAQTTTANGGAAASSQGDGATELVTPEVIRWRDHIARKAWRGADQGAAAIAGSYWKNCTGEGELASLPKVQRSLLYTSTLDELTARGISEPHSFLDEIGVKNKALVREQAA